MQNYDYSKTAFFYNFKVLKRKLNAHIVEINIIPGFKSIQFIEEHNHTVYCRP